MAFVPKRKSSQSQSLVSLGDVMAYVWGETCSALGLARRPPEEAEPATSHVSCGLASVSLSKAPVSMQNLAFSYQSETDSAPICLPSHRTSLTALKASRSRHPRSPLTPLSSE